MCTPCTCFFQTEHQALACFRPVVSSRQNIKRSHVSGLSFGFSQAIVFFAYAACFSFGAWLIDQGTITYEDMFKYVLLLVCLNDVRKYLLCFKAKSRNAILILTFFVELYSILFKLLDCAFLSTNRQ